MINCVINGASYALKQRLAPVRAAQYLVGKLNIILVLSAPFSKDATLNLLVRLSVGCLINKLIYSIIALIAVNRFTSPRFKIRNIVQEISQFVSKNSLMVINNEMV